MSEDNPKIVAAAYTVALLYIKDLEMDAITAMLDAEHASVSIQQGDDNKYTLGRIGKHNVVIVGAPRGAQGTSAMAYVAGSIRLAFPNVNVGLLVGIGGGVPVPGKDVRLGDVVVGAPEWGPAVVQFDFGNETPEGFKTQHERTLNKPPNQLLHVVDAVKNRLRRQKKGDLNLFEKHLPLFEEYPNMADDYKRPTSADRLFQINYPHDGTDCNTHDPKNMVPRDPRKPPEQIKIHYSTILSANQVMRSEAARDRLSAQFNNALCFEMEAAGIMDTFPCLVIRGICDYSDSHKNDGWQHFAAGTAAAYAREVLLNMDERVVKGLSDVKGEVREGYLGAKDKAGDGGSVHAAPLGVSGNITTFSGSGNTGIQAGQNFGDINWTANHR
jgi:nucleoside phosphorylase